jgi:hypothetical protein
MINKIAKKQIVIAIIPSIFFPQPGLKKGLHRLAMNYYPNCFKIQDCRYLFSNQNNLF